MYNYNQETKKRLDKVLKLNDIYHITSLPIEFASIDAGGFAANPTFLSFQWIYDRLGFYNSIRQYDTFMRRIIEFQQAGDFLNTLRQRLNITHEMIKCNLDSNLPVHITCCNKEGKEDNKFLDLKNIKKDDFLISIHPGQTRAQGSVFLRDPLKNVLLYIKKDQKIEVKNYDFIKKLTTKKEIIKVYREDNTLHGGGESEIDFFMPGNAKDIEDGLKKHIQTDTFILKANNIKTPGKDGSLHSSVTYLPKTFISMNDFAKIFFSNYLKIYTNNSKRAVELIERGRKKLLNSILKDEKDKYLYSKLTRISRDMLKEKELNGGSTWGRWANLGKLNHDFIIQNLTEEEALIGEMTNTLIKISKEESIHNLGYNYIEKDISDYKKIVEDNSYKGFCIVVNTEELKTFERDLAELFFCIPASYSLARTKNKSIAIINCEHKYWKGEGEIKEYIINDNFCKEWHQ